MKNFLLSAAIAATLISSAAFADSGSKLSAFDGIPSEAVQAKELDAVSGQGATYISASDAALKALVGVKVTATNMIPAKVPSYVGTSTPARLNNAFGSVSNMNGLSNASKNYGDLTKVGNNYVTTKTVTAKQPVVVYTTRK
ncbi:MAG: hypothetical protein WCL34_10330 [Methylococcaceae bacterium]